MRHNSLLHRCFKICQASSLLWNIHKMGLKRDTNIIFVRYCQTINLVQWNLSNWTPVYIEHLRTLNNFSCPGTLPLEINGRLPGYIEHQICSRRPHLTCLLWTFCTDLKLFTENEDKWDNKINCFVKWYYSNAEHMMFLTIWRKWGKDIVDFAMKWTCFSNYPWFCFYFTQHPITQNLDTLNTCVHWTFFHFPWMFNVDRFHCISSHIT